MVKLLLIILILLNTAYGNTKIPELTEKFKELKVQENTRFEDEFNSLIKMLDQALERERNICLGEIADENGSLVQKKDRQLCLRKIKENYLAAFYQVHRLRKMYMNLTHQNFMLELDANYEKQKAELDKSF